MAKLVQVVYVGNKPVATDNITKSGKQWAGYGDVQEVTVEQARMLTRYPDQWALGDHPLSREDIARKLTEVHAAAAARGSGVGVGGKRLEDMDRAELALHADRYYGLTLDREKPLPQMLQQLENFVRDAGQTAEFERNKALLGPEGERGGEDRGGGGSGDKAESLEVSLAKI